MKYLVLFPARVFEYAALEPVQSLLLLLKEGETLDQLEGMLEVGQKLCERDQIVLLYELFDATYSFLETFDVLAHLITALDLFIELQQFVQVISGLLGCEAGGLGGVALVEALADVFNPLALQSRRF